MDKGGININLEEAGHYINGLYEKGGINRKEYIESTELKKFGSVVDEDISRILQILFRLTRPQKVLEIGTSIGYSTVSMATIVKEYGGKITTIEYDENVAEQAIKNFERFKVAENIEVKLEPGKRPGSITLQPAGTNIPFTYKNGIATIQLPSVKLYDILEIKF